MQHILYYLCINLGMALVYLADRGHKNNLSENVIALFGITVIGIPIYIYWFIFRR